MKSLSELIATATDPSGVVAVTVDGRGVAHGVEIGADWPHVVGPSALGEAVMWAYSAAGAEVAREAADAGVQNESPATDVGAENHPPATEARGERSIQDLNAAVQNAWQELERARERLAGALARTSVTGSRGLLRLGFDRGRVTGMEVVDRRRATTADPGRLAAEAFELLRSITPDDPKDDHRHRHRAGLPTDEDRRRGGRTPDDQSRLREPGEELRERQQRLPTANGRIRSP